MKRNETFFVVGAVLFLAVLMFNSDLRGSLFSTFGFEDGYSIYDDFTIPSPELSGLADLDGLLLARVPAVPGAFACQILPSGYNDTYGIGTKWIVKYGVKLNSVKPCGGAGIFYSGDDLIVSAGEFSEVELTSTKDFRGGDIKIEWEGYSTGGGCVFKIGAKDIVGNACSDNERHNIEIISSRIDDSKVDVFVDGFKTSSLTLSEEEIPVSFIVSGSSFGGAKLTLEKVKYKLAFSCNVSAGEFLAYEPFAGGREIGIDSFRHEVQHFCLAHPVVIFEDGKGTTTSAEPYQTWVSGETLTIPDNQIWGVFYIMKNDGTIPVICDASAGEAYNVETETCTSASGLITICTEGAFDPASGTCVVQPEIREVCEYGRFDVALNACIYNPPIQAVCENPDAVYIPESGKCELIVDTEISCSLEGGTFNPERQVCEWFPLKTIICSDPLAAYDSTIDRCVRVVDSEIECDGVYNEVTGICTSEVPTQPECSAGVLFEKSDGSYSCIFEPELDNVCLQGSYNEELDSCIVEPDLQYLCTRGVLSSDGKSCVVTPDTEIRCAEGTEYDSLSESCVFSPGTAIDDVREGFPIFGNFNSQKALVIILVLVLFAVAASKYKKRKK